MVANNLSIVIRTCKPRLQRSTFLQHALASEFCVSTDKIIVNSKPNYSQGFFCELIRYLEHLKSTPKYILVVEDDMLFSNSAKSTLQEAIRFELPHLWCSIPEKRLVDESTKISESIRSVRIAAPLYYSGAILFEVSFLKYVLTNYSLKYIELTQPNFDVFVSSEILNCGGSMFLSHTSFATDPCTSSVIESSATQLHRFTPEHIDAYFDFNNTSPFFTTHTYTSRRLDADI